MTEMKLTMRAVARDRDAGLYESGSPIRYTVEGLPPGEEALITKLDASWRITRVKGSIRTESPVDYKDEHEALAALQQQYDWA